MSAMITVDIGGTSMRAATYTLDTIKPLIHQKIPTRQPNQSVYDLLVGLIHSVWLKNLDIEAIVVASAGPLDSKTGYIFDAPNIPGWTNFPLGEKLSKEFPIPIFFGNDANLAAMGEWKYGSGVGHSDLIYMTISTGIGSGIICNNLLVEGAKGLAGELGHITVIPDGPTCPCGKQGHLEAISSGPAIVAYMHQKIINGERSVLEKLNDFSAFDVASAAKAGDQLSIQAYSRAGTYLGLGLASIIHMLNPSIVILGGGVSQSGPLLIDPMMERLKHEVMDPFYMKDLQIVPCTLGDEVGLLGALAFGRQKLGLK